MRKRDIFFELLDFSHIHMIIFNSNPSKWTLSICLSNKTFKKSKPNTHTHTNRPRLVRRGWDHCGHICKYTPLPPHTPTHHTHTQTDQGLSGGGGDHCGNACKYTSLPPHTPTHPTHTQTDQGLSGGAEIIVSTPVSIHPYPKPSPYTQSDQRHRSS